MMRRTRSTSPRPGSRAALFEWVSLAGVIAVWWILTIAVLPWAIPQQAFAFPSPVRILGTIYEDFVLGGEALAIGQTLWRYFIGLGIAAVAGIVGGVLLGMNRTAYLAAEPFMTFMRSLPGITLLPILTVFLGIGSAQKIALVALVAVWPILLNVIDGVRSVESTLLDSAKAYRVLGLDRLRHVILPAALPQAFVGLRLAVAIALGVTVTSELIGASDGLGYYLVAARGAFDSEALWAGIIVLGVIGCLLVLLFLAVERVVLAWHRGAKASVVG